MKIFKRILWAILIIIAVGFLFRGWIYRHVITYKSMGQRANYSATNNKLIDFIEKSVANNNNSDIKEIIEQSLSITSHQLNFTACKNDNDPNKLICSKTAHCVGYAAFFSTTCNYLIKKQNISDTWTAKPQIGQLYLFGSNIHKYFSSPFFEDHDFVIIENNKTGEVFAVDPTVNDYLCIDYVTYKK